MTAARRTARRGFSLLKQTFKEFIDDDCPRLAAALSYYTFFSLPPLLVLVVTIAGLFVQPEQIAGEVQGQIEDLIGPRGAEQIQTMIEQADRPGAGGPATTLLGIGALLFGATGAFAQLQRALNTAWNVAPDPEASGFKNFFMKRLFSFGMILGIAFLLLVSLALSAALSAFGSLLTDLMGASSYYVLVLLDTGLNLGVITFLFAALFKVLPDAEIAWRDVWIGAAVTALLFVTGRFLIGLYLGQSDPGSAYGAAGSLALILVWVYYSSMILLVGAEFTQVWARRYGKQIRPSPGAVRVVTERKPIREPEEQPVDGRETG